MSHSSHWVNLPPLCHFLGRRGAITGSLEDIDYKVETIADHVDPPRFFPLIGPAQMHHVHWKCTVSYTEVVEGLFPFPYTCKQRRTQVLYLDGTCYFCDLVQPEEALVLQLRQRPADFNFGGYTVVVVQTLDGKLETRLG